VIRVVGAPTDTANTILLRATLWLDPEWLERLVSQRSTEGGVLIPESCGLLPARQITGGGNDWS
jgi:hypothetical protein